MSKCLDGKKNERPRFLTQNKSVAWLWNYYYLYPERIPSKYMKICFSKSIWLKNVHITIYRQTYRKALHIRRTLLFDLAKKRPCQCLSTIGLPSQFSRLTLTQAYKKEVRAGVHACRSKTDKQTDRQTDRLRCCVISFMLWLLLSSWKKLKIPETCHER